ncbi:uncharacterized protein LOC132731417 [Ruditapes philippinarum]|uniref:uncharacterized protein LOC132731417 n=1 Tax=Ruditapes philippinarum TaxID=129788 RepID=UPI00295B0E35|nr:uncharacterized protein LOC132731417 [Ruditapes philippinarum]
MLFYCVYMIFFCVEVSATPIKHTSDFKFANCTEDESNKIVCDPADLKEADNEEFISEWPSGPYVLPMSIHGCPESWKQGWEEGVLSITWASQLKVFTQNSSSSANDSTNGSKAIFHDVTTTKWPEFQTYVFGPFDDKTFKLKFCFKRRSARLNDTIEWPEKEFSIYGTNETCPKGFIRKNLNITLPAISYWYTDGYTPDIQIEQDTNSANLKILLCSRMKSMRFLNERGL